MSSDRLPLVSVIIPTYDRARLVYEAADAVRPLTVARFVEDTLRAYEGAPCA